jgi:hypothetical protein
VSDCNHSAQFISKCIISSNSTVKTVYLITVPLNVFRICEPSNIIFLLCVVLIYHDYLFVQVIPYLCLLISASSMYSVSESVVSPVSSGREGGVFTYGGSLSVFIKNRFRVVSSLRQVGLVGRESQQTKVPGCCELAGRRI